VSRGLEAFDGRLEKAGRQLYTAHVPPQLSESGSATERGPLTFSRDFAMDNEGIEYLSPDDELVRRLREQVLSGDRGRVGLKMVPFVDNLGITFVYRVSFEDGTGETIREELVPVFLDLPNANPRRPLGQQVLDADSIRAKPDGYDVQELISARKKLETEAERYIANVVGTIQTDIESSREEDITKERENLEAYAAAERERIEAFIDDYEQQAAEGEDMAISLRRQRQRLENLEERVEERKAELERREQIISLAPEVEGYCLTLPVD
jgi:hypothetical protein